MTAALRLPLCLSALLAAFLLALCAGPASLAQIPLPAPAPAPTEEADQAEPLPLASPDAQIQQRLAALFREVDGLQTVTVTVRSGVVGLGGSVLTRADREKAEDIAARLEGVVAVENGLRTERRVARRLEPLLERGSATAAAILSFLPLLLVAATVFVAFWYAGVRLTRTTRVFRRLAPNLFIERLLEQVVRILFILVGLVLALSILGATALLGSILGAAGLVGLAVGFAVRDTIENYLAGILLSIRQPFAPNDHVVIEGFDGRITTLTSRVTVLTTWDGSEVQIPNATVYKANLTNYTRTPDRRFDFEMALDYGNDMACALASALGAVKRVDGVLADPAPAVVIDRVDGYAVVIKVFGWIDQRHSDFGKVKSECVRQVKQALEAAHVFIAVPLQNVRRVPDDDQPGDKAEPAHEDLKSIEDTTVDNTLRDKVHQIRAESAADDLLDPHKTDAADPAPAPAKS